MEPLILCTLTSPFIVKSIRKAKYFINFINDKSKMMWIEIFKNKNPTLKAFQDFKSFVKSKSRSRIRILIFNNKGEFYFEKFNKFYNQKGIIKELMQPYSPQHNGIIEHQNYKILKNTRYIITKGDFPKALQVELVHLACYLLNRRPSKSLDQKIPLKVFFF